MFLLGSNSSKGRFLTVTIVRGVYTVSESGLYLSSNTRSIPYHEASPQTVYIRNKRTPNATPEINPLFTLMFLARIRLALYLYKEWNIICYNIYKQFFRTQYKHTCENTEYTDALFKATSKLQHFICTAEPTDKINLKNKESWQVKSWKLSGIALVGITLHASES